MISRCEEGDGAGAEGQRACKDSRQKTTTLTWRKGRAGPSSESGRGSERSGSINSFAINVAHGASARGPYSDVSTPSITSSPTLPWTPISTSPEVSNLDLDLLQNPATRLKPLANPFPDPSLRIQTQPPNPRHLALPPLPVPGPVPGPSRHGPSDNTAPQLPLAVYNAMAQLQERLRGVSLGPVRAVPSQIEPTSNGRLGIRGCASMNSSGPRDGYDGKKVLPVMVLGGDLRGWCEALVKVHNRGIQSKKASS